MLLPRYILMAHDFIVMLAKIFVTFLILNASGLISTQKDPNARAIINGTALTISKFPPIKDHLAPCKIVGD